MLYTILNAATWLSLGLLALIMVSMLFCLLGRAWDEFRYDCEECARLRAERDH